MRPEKHLLELALAASALVHAGAAGVLPKPAPTASSPRAPVQFVAQRSARVPEPEVEPEPAPQPPPEPPKAKRAPAQPTAAPAAPAQLSGTTLTAAGDGPGFAVPEGDGTSRSEPIVTAPAPETKPAPAAPAPRPTPPPPPPPPKIVEQRDLSRRPDPPALASTLGRHYPEDARRRGVGGQAVVRARVDADGKVRTASVVSETEPGFGAACQSTLVGSKWTAPLDRDGRPVGTWVRYTCRFRVGL